MSEEQLTEDFNDLFTDEEFLPLSDELEAYTPPSGPYTSRVASLAAIASTNVASDVVDEEYDTKFNQFKATIEDGGEESLRNSFDQKYIDEQRSIFEDVALTSLSEGIFDADTRSEHIQGSLALLDKLEETSQNGLEELAIQKIKDMALSNEDQLDIAEEMLGNTEALDIEDAIRRHTVRALDFLKDLEDVTKEVKDQGLIEDVADVLLTIMPLNFPTSSDNLVDYIGSVAKTLMMGSNLQAQSRYLMFNAPEAEYQEVKKIFLERLREQSGFLSENSHIVKHNLSLIVSGMSDQLTDKMNALGILDGMFAIPFTTVVRKSSSALSKMLLNRELAKDTVAKSILKDTEKATGKESDVVATQTADEVADTIEDSLTTNLKPEPMDKAELPGIGGVVHKALTEVREAVAAINRQLGGLGRLEGPEFEKLVESEIKRLREVNGNRVVPIDVFAGEVVTEQGVPHVIIGLGKKRGGLFKNEAEALKAIKRMELKGAEAAPVPEGGWFVKMKYNARESQFYKTWTDKDVGVRAPFLHLLRNPDSFNPEVISAMSAQASFNKSVLFKSYKIIQKKLQGLPKQERKRLDEITILGTDSDKWFTPTQFVDEYMKAYKHTSHPVPLDREVLAYQAQKELHDLNWGVLDWSERVKLSSQGWIGGALKGVKRSEGRAPTIFKPIEGEIHSFNNMIIHNTTDGSTLFGRELNTEILANLMKAGDLKLYKVYDEIITPDGTPAGYVLAKNGDFTEEALGQVVPYRGGAPRAYDAHYFTKQFNSMNIGGRTVIRNPLTILAGRSRTELKEATENLEKARLLHKEDKLTDDLVEELTPYVTKEEWEKAIARGEINADHPFRIVKDKEAPLRGGESVDEAGHYDIRTEQAGPDMSREASGRLLMSRRGKRLLGGDYKVAKIISPMDLIQEVSTNLLHTASFTDFQVSAISRWSKTYANVIEQKGVSPDQLFWKGTIKTEGVPESLINKAVASRAAIKRILGEGSEHSRLWRHGMTRLAEWAEHGSIPLVTKATGKRVDDIVDPIASAVRIKDASARLSAKLLDHQARDPINAIKGLAFELKLGLMDPSQLIIQTQTIAAMATIRPTKVKTYLWDGAWMRYAHVNQSDEFLNMAAKRADMDADEFKIMVKEMKEGGYIDVNGELILTDHHSTSLYGPKGSVIATARNIGRWPFYEAERLNRVYAYRMAWDDMKVAFPELDKAFALGDAQRFLARKTNDYTMNMINTSAAAYQKGIFAVPAQFMSYQMRMMENIFASKTLTAGQRVRMGMGQLLLYGANGVPFGNYLADAVMGGTGAEFGDDLAGQTAKRAVIGGLFDSMIYLATTGEVDVAFSKRAAVGQGIQTFIEGLFNMGMHEKSTMEVLGGAAFSVAGDVFSDAYDAIKLISLAASSEQVGSSNMGRVVAETLAANISSASRLLKGYYIWKYGVLTSQETGKTLSFTTKAETLAGLLGIPLREMADLDIMNYALKNRQAFIKENGNLILRFRNDAMRKLVYDDDEEGYLRALEMSSALLQVYDLKDRYDILAYANGQQQTQTIIERYTDRFMRKFPDRQRPSTGNQ
jgi:hypothetical protein